MDPDSIFIIFLFLIVFVLTIGSIIGLFRKIWKSNFPNLIKILLIVPLLIFLVFAILKFDTVESGNVVLSTVEIIMLAASFLIGLNWSINLTRKQSFQKANLPQYLKIIILTIIFTILIPGLFYLTANFFDKLNLMGNGG
jgi:hypothetical protein